MDSAHNPPVGVGVYVQRVIGESAALADMLDQASLVAGLERPVLVIGERGSGKELVADRVHFLSSRWGKELHKVNCAAISDSLLDSELFGHEAGAFTGATKLVKGRFERAHEGTLFLDELATMPLRIQEKLLRVIEYGEFERLGGQKTITVNVRIVAATNANLPKMVEQHQFRGDLLDRLAFDVIHVPPLRNRVEDIPILAEHFATRMCYEMGWEYYAGFSVEVMEQLVQYPWPGNVRELKNVVERSLYRWGQSDDPVNKVIIDPFNQSTEEKSQQVLVEPQAALVERNLGGDLAADDEPQSAVDTPKVDNTKKMDFESSVRNYEVKLIKAALSACQYRQKDAADYLSLTYHQLRAMIKKYKNELK